MTSKGSTNHCYIWMTSLFVGGQNLAIRTEYTVVKLFIKAWLMVA